MSLIISLVGDFHCLTKQEGFRFPSLHGCLSETLDKISASILTIFKNYHKEKTSSKKKNVKKYQEQEAKQNLRSKSNLKYICFSYSSLNCGWSNPIIPLAKEQEMGFFPSSDIEAAH